MTQLQSDINPFVLMTDPQAVFAALARSGRLGRLESRLCRPLDQRLASAARDEEAERDETDNAVIELRDLPAQSESAQ